MKIRSFTIAILMFLTAGICHADIVGMWNFSEGQGENTYSEVGSLTLQRGTSQSTWANAEWYKDGLSGYCMQFINEKGTSEDDRDFLTPIAEADVSPVISTAFTIDAWVKTASLPEGFSDNDPYYIVWAGDKENINSNNYFIRTDSSNLRSSTIICGFYYDNAGTPTYNRYIHPTKIEPGVWYRIVFSYDSTLPSANAKVWINDSLYTEDSTLLPITTGYTTPWLVVGAARRTGSHFRCFDGLIDQVRIYSHAVQDLSELDQGDCNYPGMVKNEADIDGDCYVDIADFALISQEWLDCTDPNDVSCH